VAAGLGTAAEHALISLLALNGLRVSEATSANIEALGTERGYPTLAITRKGGKKAVIPLAPRTARAIDLAIGERCEGPIFTTLSGQRLTGTPPGGSSAASPARQGSSRRSTRTRCATRSSPPPSTQVSRCATSRKLPPTPTLAPP
jgi:integrase